MRKQGFAARHLLLACAALGMTCCGRADPLVAVSTVGKADVPDVATTHIGTIRLLALGGGHAIVPYSTAGTRVLRLFVPEKGAVKEVVLQQEMDSTAIGEGCISDDALRISIPEWTAQGEIFLHVIDRSGNKHDKRAVTEVGPVLRAAFNCNGLVMHTRSAAGEALSYRPYDAGNVPTAGAWTVQARKLFERDGPVTITDIHPESGRINVMAVDVQADSARLVAALSLDGKKIEDQLDAALFDPSLQRIVATSYGYAADKRASLLERSAEYLLLDPSLRVMGRMRVAASGPPMVAVPGNKAFLLPNLVEVGGQPRLEILRVEANGRTQRDPDGAKKNPALSNVVFGTTMLGIVGTTLFAVSAGTELQKVAAGFQLKDALYYFPLQLL